MFTFAFELHVFLGAEAEMRIPKPSEESKRLMRKINEGMEREKALREEAFRGLDQIEEMDHDC